MVFTVSKGQVTVAPVGTDGKAIKVVTEIKDYVYKDKNGTVEITKPLIVKFPSPPVLKDCLGEKIGGADKDKASTPFVASELNAVLVRPAESDLRVRITCTVS